MAIDQRDVSSTLRFMDDRALQQYAAMHKNDPYIFPLAFQESQNRQRLRMSQQTQMAQQPQPKVVDQALAGISALPADNMEQMADGGIVGYEGYDESGVPNTFGQGPVVMMAEGGVARYQAGGLAAKYQQESQEMVSGNRVQYSPDVAAYAEQLAATERAAAQAGEQAFLRQEQQRMLRGPYATPPVVQQPSPTDASFRRQPDPRMMGVAATAQPLITSDAAPKVDTGRGDTERKTAERKITAATTPADKQSAGLASLDIEKMTNEALEAAEKRPNPFAAEISAVGREKVAAKEAEVAGITAIQKQFDDIFKGRKERLETKEKQIAKMGDQNLGLALLQAGAAMMTTPGKIGTALGKGIDTGSKQYAAGLDKINAAKDKLSDARDRLEEIEAQRGEMSARELLKARNDVRNTEISAKEDLIKANMQMYGVNREQALKMVENRIKVATTIYEQQQANVRTDKQVAAANRTPAEIQVVERIMKEQNVPFTEALAIYSGSKRQPMSEERLRSEWLDPAKRLQIAQDYPNVKTFEDYKTVMGAGGGGGGDFKLVGARPAK